MAAVCGWGVENGEPERLLRGHDSWGNICGKPNYQRIPDVNSGLDMSDYPHAYNTLDTTVGFRQLCVRACPTSYTTDSSMIQSLGLCLGVGSTPYNAPGPNTTGEAAVACPSFTYSAFLAGITDRCFPSANSTLTRLATASFNAQGEVEQAMADVYDAIDIIAWMCVASVAGVFVLISLMRWCAGPMVYVAIITCFVFLCCCTGAFIYATAKARADLNDEPEEERTKAEKANYALLVFGTIVFSIVLVLYTCIVVAMRQRIAQAIDIFEEAAVALWKMPTTFLCPFITAFFMVLWLASCIAIVLYVATANDFDKNEDGYIGYEYTKDQQFLLWYMVFAIFWGSQLLLAMLEFVVASNTAMWYLHKEDPPGWPLKTSIFYIFRYHFGTLAFGAMLVAIIQMVRAIFEFIEHQAKKGDVTDSLSCLRKWIFNCIRCCLICLEKLVKWINKNAYIETAIWGSSFCKSCWDVFSLLQKHLSLIAIVNGVAYLIVFIIKLGVVVGAAFVTYIWVRTKEEIEFYFLIVVIVALLSFMLVDAFTDVYEMCAESILILALEDHDKNSPGPFLMSSRMASFKMGERKLGESEDGGKYREGRGSTVVNEAGPDTKA